VLPAPADRDAANALDDARWFEPLRDQTGQPSAKLQ